MITGSGLTATLRSALTVDCRPQILGFNVSSAAPGQQVDMRVAWPARTPPGVHATTTLGQLIIDGPAVDGPGPATCTFTVPFPLDFTPMPTTLPVTVTAGGPASPPVQLKIRT